MAGWSGLARRSARRTFRDRREAGQVLAQELTAYHGRDDLLVLGLARGGVPVGWEVAAALRAPLDVFLVRKLGVPQWEELAMGALASGGGLVVNDKLVKSLNISDEALRAAIDRETEELNRREQAYRGGRDAGGPEGFGRDHRRRRDRHRRKHARRRARGACRTAGKRCGRGSGRSAVGVPCNSAGEADDVVCVTMPTPFEAVGQVYADFHQVSDDEVRELLATPTS